MPGLRPLNKIATKIGSIEDVLLFDISALAESGSIKIQPAQGKKVTITMLLPASVDPARAVVAHIKDDGSVEILDSKVENGYITFSTSSFSTFAIAEAEAAGTDSTTEQDSIQQRLTLQKQSKPVKAPRHMSAI
jgi:hypothetical protein